jgi:hypothetical protein
LIASLSDLRSALEGRNDNKVSDLFQKANNAATELQRSKVKLFSTHDNFHHREQREDTESTENGN